MYKPELTIIIPCYNCSKTLREAVESCFHQELDEFEIVMVDDGSTDGTFVLMKELQNEHPEHIRIFQNEKNLGGGATRNKAVAESKSEIIFCLDSDDILPEGTMRGMLSYMKENDLDGVGIHKSIKFRGVDKNKIERVDTFSFAGKPIPIDSLLQKHNILCPLYSTFMVKKSVHESIGGYPTKHGFDTQGMAWRFLMNGYKAHTCPEAAYLHRLYFNKSYYVREYESGKVNHNWLMIFEEFLCAFSDNAQKLILSFDVNSRENIMQKVSDTENSLSADFSKRKQEIGQIPIDTLNTSDSLKYWYLLQILDDKSVTQKEKEHLIYSLIPFALKHQTVADRIYSSILKLNIKIPREQELESLSRKFNTYTSYGSREPLYKKIIRRIKKYVQYRRKKTQ